MPEAATFHQHEIRCPTFTIEEAGEMAREIYGLGGVTLKPLHSFQDQNFRVTDEEGRRFVLKIAHTGETFETLDLQNQAMQHINAKDPAFPTPRVIPTKTGEGIGTATGTATGPGERHFVRMVSYLPGGTLVDVKPRAPAFLEEVGRVVGALSRHLGDFDHPAADRVLQWDLRHAKGVTEAFLPFVRDEGQRERLKAFLARFEPEVLPLLPRLRTSVIHGDIVDHNLLVARDGVGRASVSGIIDFGDAVRSYTVGELAVLLATIVVHNPEDPLAAAARVAQSYHAVFPLTEAEVAVLFPLVCLRVCATTTSAAHQAALEPDNAYVAQVAEAEWVTLELLERIPGAVAHATFRHACGLAPSPKSAAVQSFLREHAARFAPVVDVDWARSPAAILDLSVGSDELRYDAWMDPARVRGHIAERSAKGGTAVGRYAEARLLYTRGDSPTEPRTVHLGVDIFLPAKTAVFAPLPGVVERVGSDALVLRHAPPDGGVFYTRYAGVTPSRGAAPGDCVERGQLVARVAGAGKEAAPLPPHVHFQVACDLPEDLPALARGSEREVWLSICPDPNLILRIPGLAPAHETPSAAALVTRRAGSLPKSQEAYYKRPMPILRGFRQYLIDDAGRSYLDAINNVAHLGHCHPRVVEAAYRQMALLNTNSRFLYESMIEYAERLAALLPDPLRVVFPVCSGSEANDLALRLARAYTGQEDVLSIDGAYHGNTTATFEVSTSLLDNPLAGKDARRHIHPVAQPNTFRGPYGEGDPEAGARYAESVRGAIEGLRAEGRGPAAFIGECLLGAPGGMLPPPGYFKQVYRDVREAGGVCIADEVQVGFGRMGTHFWAFEMQGVVPDIVTMGKPMGNGHPVSAVVTTAEIAEAFRRRSTYFNTYGGNPVSSVVGMAVLDVMRDEGLMENARVVGGHFKARLEALKEKHAMVGAVYGWGLYLGVDLVRDRATKAPATEEAMLICERMRDYGVIVYPTGDFYNILKIKPPMVLTRENAEFFAEMLDRVLIEGW